MLSVLYKKSGTELIEKVFWKKSAERSRIIEFFLGKRIHGKLKYVEEIRHS